MRCIQELRWTWGWLGFVWAIAGLACAASPTGPEQPPLVEVQEPPRGDPATGYVLVWKDAPLHQRPSAASPFVRVVERLPERRPGDVYSFRVQAEHGDWLELEPLTNEASEEHCYPPPKALRGLGLRLFVARSELAPVLRRTKVVDIDERRVLTLAEGAHVEPLERGWGLDARGEVIDHLLGAGDFSIPVALDADDVGARYDSSGSAALVEIRRDRSRIPDFDAGPRVGGVALVDQRRDGGPVGRGYCGYLRVTHDRRPALPNKGRTRAQAFGAGTQLRGEWERHEEIHTLSPYRRKQRRWEVRLDDPPLRWPNGASAGRALEDVEVLDVRPAAEIPGYSCFEPIGPAGPWVLGSIAELSAHERLAPLRLCAPSEAFDIGGAKFSGRIGAQALSPAVARGPVPLPVIVELLRPQMDALVACSTSPMRSGFEFWIDEQGRTGVDSRWAACVAQILDEIEWPAGHTRTEVRFRDPQLLAAAWSEQAEQAR